MKKMFIWFLVTIFTASIAFAGIGCKAEEVAEEVVTEVAEETAEEEVAEETAEEEKESITIQLVDDNLGNQAKKELSEAVVKEFQEEYPNITVKYDPWNHQDLLSEGMFTLFAEGSQPPDVFWIRSGYWADSFMAADRLLDLTPYLEETTFDGSMKWGEYFNSDIAKDPSTGAVTYVPMALALAQSWWYNKAIFSNLGLSEPSTWEEFMDVCQKIKDSGTVPISMGSKMFGDALLGVAELIQRQVGSQKYNDVFLQENNAKWNDPDIIAAFELFNDLLKNGYVVESVALNEEPEMNQIWFSGDAAMIQTGGWQLALVTDPNFEEYKDIFPDGADFFLAPSVPNGVGDPSGIVTCVETYAISKETKHAREAVDFLKCYTQDKYGEMMLKAGFICPWAGMTEKAAELGLDPLGIKQIEIVSNSKDNIIAPDVAFGNEQAEAFNEAINWIVLGEKTVEEALNDLQNIFEEEFKE